MRAAVIALVVALAAAQAHASPAQDLEKARKSFRAKDWESAAQTLWLLLYPTPKLGDRYDLVEAHVLYGVALFESGHREEARAEFEAALSIQPEKTLDPLLYSVGAVRQFDETRADLAARAERDAERKKLAEDRERLRKYRESLVVFETRPYYVNFFPFGFGQFQEHRTGRGAFFAVSQGITGGASVGLFLYLAGTYGLDAKVPVADVPRVRQLQQITIASEVAFFGFYAWGVIDSIVHYKPRVQIQGDDSLLPPDLRDIDKKPKKKTSLRERIQISPMITPTGVGIGIGLEN